MRHRSKLKLKFCSKIKLCSLNLRIALTLVRRLDEHSRMLASIALRFSKEDAGSPACPYWHGCMNLQSTLRALPYSGIGHGFSADNDCPMISINRSLSAATSSFSQYLPRSRPPSRCNTKLGSGLASSTAAPPWYCQCGYRFLYN